MIELLRRALTMIGWKGGTIAASFAMVVLGGFLVMAQLENRHLSKVNANLDALINDPKVGYVAKLAQAETNTATLKLGLERQRDSWKAEATKNARLLAETTARLAAAQDETRRAERQVGALLATKPRGATLEARVLDVDQRLLETLK